MHKILIVLTVVLILLSITGCGEFVGSDDDDVSIGKAQKMEIYLSDENLYRLYNTVAVDTSVSCSVIFDKWKGDGRLKVRGYTSRMHAKKSFLLKIDGKKYVLERGHASGGIGTRIAMRTYQLAGLNACDTRTIGLFLNDEYLGCYNFITYYDEDVMGGELYKSYFEDYNHMENNHPLRSLSEKKFPDDDNFANLENLLAAVTTLSDADWHQYVLDNVDIEKVAAYLAVHDFLLVKDTFRTNLYIAYNGKFYFLPWDNESCIKFNADTYEMGGDNQLTRRMTAVAEVKEAYNRKMRDLFINGGIMPTLRTEVDKILDDASGAVKSDPNYKDNYNDFLDSKARVQKFFSATGRVQTLSDPVLP